MRLRPPVGCSIALLSILIMFEIPVGAAAGPTGAAGAGGSGGKTFGGDPR